LSRPVVKQQPPASAVEASAGALSPALAGDLVLIASGAVLVLEILSVRLLALYVGLTLETTTSIIGAVLAGIAAIVRLVNGAEPLREDYASVDQLETRPE